MRSLSKSRSALLATFAICTAVFLTALDQTVVVTALPQMIQDLEIQVTQLDQAAWIVSGYLLGYVVVMPLMGRISDLYGRRQVLLICLTIFALGSLFCGLAPRPGNWNDLAFLAALGVNTEAPGLVWLVLARFVQAVGGGAIVPVAMAVAGDFYGHARRGFALGLIGMVTEAGGVLGPLYGAFIVQIAKWPAIFYLNLPIVALLALLIFLFIPATNPAHSSEESTTQSEPASVARPSHHLDIIGSLLLGASLICLSLGLAQQAAQITPEMLATQQGGSQNNPLLVLLALILLAIFVAWEIINERRGNEPVIAFSLFRRLMFSATSLVSFLIGAALIISMVNIPLYFLSVFNLSDIDSSLALLRLTAMIPVGAILGGWLCARITCRWTALLGLLPAIAGFWLMHLWSTQIDWTLITISTMLTGLGLGLVIAPISTTAINSVKNTQLGMASSIVTVLRMIGMILGLAGLTSWGLERFRALVTQTTLTPLDPGYASLVTSSAHTVYTGIFLAAGVLCLIALVPALFLQGRETTNTLVRTIDTEEAETVDVSAHPHHRQ